MEKGMVFDIQRFSLQDGPGIRTTVFLKGCPLRCVWCHNPESQGFKPELSLKREQCVGCGACEAVCGAGVHRVRQSAHTIQYGKCTACGRCTEACAYGALKLCGKTMTVEEVLLEVEKDTVYYEKSGGGITVSGGEPLAQPDFTLGILKAAREKGIHTCLETSGYAPEQVMEEMLPYVDLFLFDYKASGSERHRQLTGVPNDGILRNLRLIHDRGASILLRCPLIQGINDTEEHLLGIADICEKYPLLKGVELLPYHNMGKGKYKEFGRAYSLEGLENADEKQKKKWMDFLKGKILELDRKGVDFILRMS